MADEDIVVTVEDDSLDQDIQVETEPKKEPWDELKAQLAEHEEKQKKISAELEDTRRREAQERARADQFARESTQARSEAQESYVERINSSASAAEVEATSAEAEYAQAMEKGDFIAAAKAQRKIAGAEAKLVQLAQIRGQVEQQRKAVPRQSADPVENYIASVPPASQAWLRQHRDYITDPSKQQQLQRAHYHAVGEDIQPDTPEYFAHIEARLGLRKQDKPRDDQGRFVADNQEQPKAAKKASAPPAAPVNGGGAIGGNTVTHPTTVTLTKIEANAATDGTIVWGKNDFKAGRIKDESLVGQPVGVSEFARRKMLMMKDGRYNQT